MNLTMKQRSQLVRAAERGLNRKPVAIRCGRLVFVFVALVVVYLGVTA